MKLSRLAIILIIGALLGPIIAESRNTRRRLIKPSRRPVITRTVATPPRDTITNPATIDSLIVISDYQKTVASRHESLLIANRSATDTIFTIDLDINYTTDDSRQLNRRTVTLRTPIPPRQTRHVAFPSWDRQQLFYYHATPPARPSSRTRPFHITITPLSLTR